MTETERRDAIQAGAKRLLKIPRILRSFLMKKMLCLLNDGPLTTSDLRWQIFLTLPGRRAKRMITEENSGGVCSITSQVTEKLVDLALQEGWVYSFSKDGETHYSITKAGQGILDQISEDRQVCRHGLSMERVK